MRLVSMLTENYVGRAAPFLRSLSRLSGVDCCIIRLGFGCREKIDLRSTFGDGLYYYDVPRHWSESSCGIMQHGRWLDALPDMRNDEVYLLSDADIIVQRDFTLEERELFESCGENSFLAAWNAFEGDHLTAEADRIDLTPRDQCGFFENHRLVADGIFCEQCDWLRIPCFNTGILAMRGRSWKRLRDLYESRCERFYKLTSHRSRGQWLMNFCFARLGLKPEILSGEVHSHGHFGVPSDVSFRSTNGHNVAYYRDKPILFRHAF